MDGTLDRLVIDLPEPESAEHGLPTNTGRDGDAKALRIERGACFHCGEPCPDGSFAKTDKVFCCQGCLVVHDLLAENGLEQFYDLSRHPGVRIQKSSKPGQWSYLDEPALQARLLDFTDGTLSRATFQIPSIHCIACVWLLENLFRLHPGIGKSEVNFPRRELALTYEAKEIRLSELVALLASIGYEPQLTFGELAKPQSNSEKKKRWLQIGIAGFAFGNIMLFSLPGYLGLDSLSGPVFRALFGYLSLALAIPVLLYSAADYWRAALLSLRQRVLTLDVPIAVGLAALYTQSAFEISSGRGEGYLDSLAGLVFFLLCGRAFQQKTQERIAFDRDYKCFFPLSVMRKTSVGEESAALSNLAVGDRLLLRNGELIPADGRLVSGQASIDYSFVTGESEPVARTPGDYLYAGGQQVGSAIEMEIVKPVSQSYLTSLWNHEAFRKPREDTLNTLTNRYSRQFTRIVIAVALGAALFWAAFGNPTRGLKAFTSVLIVACPCALALAAPFALGTAQRWLGRIQIFLKNTLVLERMAQVNMIVFDKTGTLTVPNARDVTFHPIVPERGHSCPQPPPNASATSPFPKPGEPSRDARNVRPPDRWWYRDAPLVPRTLSITERLWISSLARHSTHPHSIRIGQFLEIGQSHVHVDSFRETPACGIQGTVEGHPLLLGSGAWLEAAGIWLPRLNLPPGSVSYVAIDGVCRGAFVFANSLRPELTQFLRQLGQHYELALLSGDNEKERELFSSAFGGGTQLHFNQGPLDKLEFVRDLQKTGRTVMMVGDGLNDAGALKQSDVGVAVVEKIGAFSPASDMILEAWQITRLLKILSFARKSSGVVRLSFGISALYNLVGISIAAAGILSPIICAVLMPLSSISVVLFACGMTRWAARREGVT